MMIKKRRITQAYFMFANNKYSRLMYQLAFRISSNTSQAKDMLAIAPEELHSYTEDYLVLLDI